VECDNYNDLIKKTSLQKLLKKELINKKEFRIGLGVLKEKY